MKEPLPALFFRLTMNAPPAARRIRITAMTAINEPDADDADDGGDGAADVDAVVGVAQLSLNT